MRVGSTFTRKKRIVRRPRKKPTPPQPKEPKIEITQEDGFGGIWNQPPPPPPPQPQPQEREYLWPPTPAKQEAGRQRRERQQIELDRRVEERRERRAGPKPDQPTAGGGQPQGGGTYEQDQMRLGNMFSNAQRSGVTGPSPGFPAQMGLPPGGGTGQQQGGVPNYLGRTGINARTGQPGHPMTASKAAPPQGGIGRPQQQGIGRPQQTPTQGGPRSPRDRGSPAPGQNFLRSDVRLKTDIEHTGTSPDGVNIYSFKYKGDDKTYQGVMAQEVPWASIEGDDGYYMVDYSKVDVAFKRLP